MDVKVHEEYVRLENPSDKSGIDIAKPEWNEFVKKIKDGDIKEI